MAKENAVKSGPVEVPLTMLWSTPHIVDIKDALGVFNLIGEVFEGTYYAQHFANGNLCFSGAEETEDVCRCEVDNPRFSRSIRNNGAHSHDWRLLPEGRWLKHSV